MRFLGCTLWSGFDLHGADKAEAYTQQFNTTTSMGRLTLNILLSFAQFEREVTGERIRDKIAASKAKGMWMGGMPPLGYDVVERKLVVNASEANLVRGIFRRYAEHGSAAQLVRELAIEGHTTKSWVTQGGQHRPGRPIDQQYLFAMLRNRIYLGEMVHKGQSFPGQHEAIVPQELWNAAHAFIDRRKQGPREQRTEHPALLAGLLFAPDGQRMIHHFTKKKNGRLYRYYVPYLHKRRNAGATLLPGTEDIGALRRHTVWIALNTDRDVAPLLIAMRLDPTAQKIGVESVSQRNRSDRDARLQAGGNYPRFEFRGVPSIPPRHRRRKYICVHVSTKNIVDTIVASGLNLDKVGWLDAYEGVLQPGTADVGACT